MGIWGRILRGSSKFFGKESGPLKQNSTVVLQVQQQSTVLSWRRDRKIGTMDTPEGTVPCIRCFTSVKVSTPRLTTYHYVPLSVNSTILLVYARRKQCLEYSTL